MSLEWLQDRIKEAVLQLAEIFKVSGLRVRGTVTMAFGILIQCGE
jgi:hypothetical protein